MTGFPAAGYITSDARTEAEVKAALEDWLAATRQLPGGQAESTLSIASGAVTPTRSVHAIDTEGMASSDDLDTIAQANLPDGSILWLHAADNARVPTVRHNQGGAGKVLLSDAANLALSNTSIWLVLERTGTAWREIGRFYGSALAAFRTYLGVGTDEYARVCSAAGLTAGAIGIVSYLTKFNLSRGFFVLLFGIGLPLLLLWRWSARRLVHHAHARGHLLTRVLISGSAARVDDVAAVLNRESWLGYTIVGALTPEVESTGNTPSGVPVVGNTSQTADSVIAAKPRNQETNLLAMAVFSASLLLRARSLSVTPWNRPPRSRPVSYALSTMTRMMSRM